MIFFMLLFSILGGCETKKTKEEKYLKISIDPGKVTISPISDFYSSIEIIPLETTNESIFGTSYKILLYNDKFYVLDLKQHAIFIFKSTGEYVSNTSCLRGSGPEQYRSITDFDIHQDSGIIDILDPYAQRIMRYDENFCFKEVVKLPEKLLPLRSFKAINEYVYLFYSKSSNKKNSGVFLYNKREDKTVKQLLSLPEKVNDLITVERHPFMKFNGDVYFTPTFPNNEVYLFCEESLTLEKVLEYDFGKYTFKCDDLLENKPPTYYREFVSNNNNKYAFILNKKENINFLFTFFILNGDLYVAKTSKKTNLTQVISGIFAQKEALMLPQIIDNNYFYFAIEPEYINEVVNIELLDKKMKEPLSNDCNMIILKCQIADK